MTAFVPGRPLDDNISALLRFRGGARGMLWASQVAPGHANTLRIGVYGDKGGLQWSHEAPEALAITRFGAATRLLQRGGPDLSAAATSASRVPAGHPEGYLEAFGNFYRDAARLIRSPSTAESLPGLVDGLTGMRFIAACLQSSDRNAVLGFYVKLTL